MHHLVLTDGSKGTWDVAADQEMLVGVRQSEQRAAAKALGADGEVVFCGWVDGELQSGPEQRSVVAEWIRRLCPDVVLGHDPWKRYRLHPDHRHAGWLTVDGCVAARDPFFHPEHGLAHHRPSALLLFEADEADSYVDVTGYSPNKVAALLEHRSQFVTTHGITDPGDPGQVRRFSDFIDWKLSEGAVAVGRTSFEHAELYRRIPL